MTLDIVIPSKDRKKKLDACLNSLFHSVKDNDVTVYLYFSIKEEHDEYEKFFEQVPTVKIKWVENYRVPDFWNSHLHDTKADAICYINDDIIFFEDTITTIFKEFQEKFPDYDGVMGLRQANIPEDQAVEGAFGVIGLPYAKRFPSKQVFCPDYDRFFGDFELWRFAKTIDKFYFCTTARIQHMHPLGNRDLEDKTHKDVRRYLASDKQTFRLRKAKEYLWGKTWNLINER